MEQHPFFFSLYVSERGRGRGREDAKKYERLKLTEKLTPLVLVFSVEKGSIL